MDALPTEDSIMKSTELIFKRKRKRARQRANRKERQQRLDPMQKNLAAPKSEESSVEDVANLENSNAQLLPLGHLEIQTESTTTLLEKSPIKKKKRKKRSGKKALNKKVDPCSMDQNSVPSKSEESSVEDAANLENSNAQLLPLGHLELQTESTTTLLEKSPIKKKKRKNRSGKKALNTKVDPCSMDQNTVPSNPSLLDNKHGEVT